MIADVWSSAATLTSAKLVPATAATLGLPSTIRINGQSWKTDVERACNTDE